VDENLNLEFQLFDDTPEPPAEPPAETPAENPAETQTSAETQAETPAESSAEPKELDLQDILKLPKIPATPPQPKPEPTPEPEPEPEPEPAPGPESEPEPEPEPEPAPEPESEPEPAPTPEPTPEPKTEPVRQEDPVQRRKKLLARRRAAQRRRTHNVLLAGVFLAVIILVAAVNLFSKDREFSDTENRSLAQKPVFSMDSLKDGSYFSGLTDHYSDQFFLRDKWMALKLREEKLLGRQESGGVYLCDDGYLIGQATAPDEAVVTKNTDAMNLFAQEHPDISTRMILAPTAAGILTDKLPENAPMRDQLADIAQVGEQLSGSIQFLDAVTPLLSHKEESIYYQTDHHWTSLGAYYVFTQLSGALGIGDPVDDYDVYTVTEEFEGTLASKSGSHGVQDSIQVYLPKAQNLEYYVTYGDDGDKICSIYQSDCLSVKDKYTVFLGGNHPLVQIQTTADNGRSLLLLKDSYANSFVQFLLPYYEKIVMVDPRYYYDSLDSLLTSCGITDVLYLFSSETFLTDSALSDVLSAS
jgi:hypothetical protein